MANELQKIEREVHRDVEEIEEKIQTSETFLLSAILALSGGFQDAYTYNVRDKVFSNAKAAYCRPPRAQVQILRPSV